MPVRNTISLLRPGRIAVCAASVGVLACSESKRPDERAPITAPALQAAAPATASGARTFDDEMADLADQVPGFGGMYMQSDGSFAVVSAMPGRELQTSQAVDAVLTQRGIAGAHRITVVRGQYNYRQLRDWLMKFATISRSGVVSSGIDSRDNRFHIGILSDAATSVVYSNLKVLGIPDSAVVVSVEKPSIALSGDAVRRASEPKAPFVTRLVDHVDVVRGGVGVSMSGTDGQSSHGPCTLTVVAAAQVFASNTLPDYGGMKYGITVSHCTPTFGVNDGSTMGNSSTSSVDRIGHEVADPPLFDHNVQPRCPVSRRCRWSDASQFALDDPLAVADIGTVYDAETNGNPAIIGSPYTLTQTFSPFAGFSVRKIGVGTGRTVGTIGQTCSDRTLFIYDNNFPPHSIDSGITLLCQYQFLGDAYFGDSGAPVLWFNNGHWNLIGIINSGVPNSEAWLSDWNWAWQELRQAWDNPPNRRMCPVVSPGTDCVFQ